MITGPPTDGQRTPLQVFETLYIGVAEPAVRRAAWIGTGQGKSKTDARCERSSTTTMARIVRGSGIQGNNTRLNNE